MKYYYLYAYLDPSKEGNFLYENDLLFNNEPFYIGKGKGNRMFIHLKKINDNSYINRNPGFYDKIREIKKIGSDPIIIKLVENINEDTALQLEKEYIKKIGRKINLTGPLLNITIGGNGFKGCNSYRGGFKGKHTNETKKKLSEFRKGKSFIDMVGEEKAKEWGNNISSSNKGKKRNFSNESINNIRNIWLGKKMPEDIRKKMSEKRKGVSPSNKGKIIYQYSIEGEFLGEIFLYDIPKEFNIPCSNVIKCCKGDRKKAGGYIWKYNKE